jgi:hypothetical protein
MDWHTYTDGKVTCILRTDRQTYVKKVRQLTDRYTPVGKSDTGQIYMHTWGNYCRY